MVNESLFLDVAKLGISMAGFVSVVAALRRGTNDGWEKKDICGLRLVVEFSLFAVVASLFPSLYKPEMKETEIWVRMSLLLGSFMLFEFFLNCYRVYWLYIGSPSSQFAKLPDKKPEGPTSPVLLFGVILLPTFLIGLLQFINAACWQSPDIVAVGMIWLLLAWAAQLVQFLRRATPIEAGKATAIQREEAQIRTQPEMESEREPETEFEGQPEIESEAQLATESQTGEVSPAPAR